jgi:fimbrial chaperone protein
MSLLNKAVLTAILCFSLINVVNAGYSLTPLITVLEPSRHKTTAEVVIKYEGADNVKVPLPIELKVKSREISLDGLNVIFHDDKAADDFVIYPAQIVLMPGETQRVQVQWVGESMPKKEIAYGLIADQAPVKLGDEDLPRTKAEGRLNILTRYEGIILVHPAGVHPNVVVDSAVFIKDSHGRPRMVITFNNIGTAMQKLAGVKLKVTSLDKNNRPLTNKSISYKPFLDSQKTNHSLFAGFRRKLDLPWPEGVPFGPVRVDAEFKEEK